MPPAKSPMSMRLASGREWKLRTAFLGGPSRGPGKVFEAFGTGNVNASVNGMDPG